MIPRQSRKSRARTDLAARGAGPANPRVGNRTAERCTRHSKVLLWFLFFTLCLHCCCGVFRQHWRRRSTFTNVVFFLPICVFMFWNDCSKEIARKPYTFIAVESHAVAKAPSVPGQRSKATKKASTVLAISITQLRPLGTCCIINSATHRSR